MLKNYHLPTARVVGLDASAAAHVLPGAAPDADMAAAPLEPSPRQLVDLDAYSIAQHIDNAEDAPDFLNAMHAVQHGADVVRLPRALLDRVYNCPYLRGADAWTAPDATSLTTATGVYTLPGAGRVIWRIAPTCPALMPHELDTVTVTPLIFSRRFKIRFLPEFERMNGPFFPSEQPEQTGAEDHPEEMRQ